MQTFESPWCSEPGCGWQKHHRSESPAPPASARRRRGVSKAAALHRLVCLFLLLGHLHAALLPGGATGGSFLLRSRIACAAAAASGATAAGATALSDRIAAAPGDERSRQ